jgi:hypothetical protein
LLLGSLLHCDKGVTMREGGTWGSVGGSRACDPCLVMFGVVQVVSSQFPVDSQIIPLSLPASCMTDCIWRPSSVAVTVLFN